MEQLTKPIFIRVTEEDYTLLQKQAEEQERSVPWIVRKVLKESLHKSAE